MEACCRKQMKIILTFTVCVVFMSNVVDSQSMPSINRVEEWATSLSRDLRKAFVVTTGYNLLNLRYNNRSDMYTDPRVFQLKFDTVNASKLVHDMSAKLTAMLENKMEALNRSVVAAEAAASTYKWNPKITEEDVKIVNVKTLLDNATGLFYHERFKQKVITNVSGVHIPVEIYDQDVKILNGLKWSEALDKTFTDNFDRDKEILWQYFGSQTGFMRTLPASRWKFGPSNVDLYDVRRRPWYTQGSSSPKDMMIILDKSGSVYGQALALMKVSVKSLLDTLGENDFVNIAMFNDKASFVTNCFNGSFMQANYRNKKIFVDAVDRIVAQGMANFKVGLEFAFEQFIKLENESESQRGAGCNKMIMLLTDGGTDNAEEVFKKYNFKADKKVRVFTYAIGPTANPVASIRWMACANRGYFSQIPAMGAIRTKVQEYMDVVSRPLALSQVERDRWTSISPGFYQSAMYVPVVSRPPAILNKKQFKWGNVYLDNLGLGMMTTVTLPVYNRTSGSLNQTILGVMGIDVTTAEMQKWSPTQKMGPNGFSFAINSNGYIVFHPNLRLQLDLREPPNVDFLEVEVDGPEMEKLRKNMINLKSDTETLKKYYKIANDQRHIDIETNRLYAYTGIGQSTFSLGVSLPEYQKHYLKIAANIKEFNKDKHLLNDSYNAILIANWEYYTNFTTGNLTGTIFDLEVALKTPDSHNWNHELINHLLWDLNITSFFSDYWRLDMSKDGFDGLVGRFVGTDGGLTRVYPKREDLVLQFMERRDTWNTDYYKRAIASDQFMFSAPYILEPTTYTNVTAGTIMAVKSVTLDNDYNSRLTSPLKYRAAVLGALLTRKSISEKLNATASGAGHLDCQDADDVACYLLDDGGFIVATNQQKHDTSVGRFFGHVDPEIMRELYNKSIYLRLEQYDYQASCIVDKEELINSASTLSFGLSSVTFLYEMLTFNWWTSVITWSFTNFNLYSMLFSSPVNQAEAAYIHEDSTRPCIMKQAQYYYNMDVARLSSSTDCEIRTINCSRAYRAVRLNETNLLLVVAEAEQADCDRCRLYIPKDDLIQEPTESDPDFCSIKPRYRKPTDKCYDYDVREDGNECAGSLTHPISRVFIILVAMVTTWWLPR